MNSKLLKVIGIAWIVIAIILSVIVVYEQATSTGALTRGYGEIDYYYDLLVSGFGVAALILIFGFLPGVYYYKLSKRKKQEKSISISGWLALVALVIFIIIQVIIQYQVYVKGVYDGLGLGLFLLFFGIWPGGILYGIALIILIVHWIKNRKH
jgi:hypothetical protein